MVERGLTVGGKSLTEHLEATNHARALDWVKERINRPISELTEKDILSIHTIILKGIDDDNAGYYRAVPVRISGSAVVMPNAKKVPSLMADFMQWLTTEQDMHPVKLACSPNKQAKTRQPFATGQKRGY